MQLTEYQQGSSRFACAAAWHSERSALPCSGSSRAQSHARVAKLHCDLVAGGQGQCSSLSISREIYRFACAAAWHSERSALPCSGSSRAQSHARVARSHCDLVAGGQGQCSSLSISREIAGLHAPQRGTASEARCRAQAHPKLNPTPELQGYIKRWLMVGRVSAAH